MQIIDLGGHSGCKILLCEEDDNSVFVRKISSSLDYNKRLETQALKQKEFEGIKIKTPAVLTMGYMEDGLFYFDMEYIQGITLAEYMKSIEIGKVRGICETIVENLVNATRNEGVADEQVFQNKIVDLSKKLESKKNTVIDEALEILIKHSWKKFKKTSCHGDLTLENIIVKDGQLYVIDFLDSFYDCWLMDISTILQDVQTMWSYRYQEKKDVNTLIRLMVFRDILMDTVKKIAYDDYIEVYYALLLKLIRIFPYTKDNETYKFLTEKTKSIIGIVRGEEVQCVP